jgi:alpha-glucuronidase
MRHTRRLMSGIVLALAVAGPLTDRPAYSQTTPSGHVDDNGCNLWLKYHAVGDAGLLADYRSRITQVIVQDTSPLGISARDELTLGLSNLLAKNIARAAKITRNGTVVVGAPATSPIIAKLGWDDELRALGDEGFIIRGTVMERRSVIAIASNTQRGALYGTFAFLRLLQSRSNLAALNISDKPVNQLRQIQDWTNWDGSIERGYAGLSILQVDRLPATVNPRIKLHARALAALGINGITLNNVNAQADWISTANLPKVRAIAAVYRDYGVKVYLAVRFDSPAVIGGLPGADPLDADVIRWWTEKAAEIYREIPDFGGFLVKADSEGQHGPSEYGRTHAQGANMLAGALKSHGGIVMWRAFVYGPAIDADRAKRSYKFYKPLDGQFADNIILQVKNGPLDFQHREPNHPLIGGMPKTQTGLELQITQEYTGQATHLVWLVPQWKSYLDFDTKATAANAKVKDVIAGTTFGYHHSLFAGVSNMGDSTNWTGQTMAQANQYGFGRLSWNPSLSADAIADEWIKITYGADPLVIAGIKSMLIGSWSTYEKYSMVGSTGEVRSHANHFDPDMAANQGDSMADGNGVGYDRTRAGSGFVDQYSASVSDMYDDRATTPPALLLWFHHVPYSYEVFPGKTVIQWIYDSHFDGEAEVQGMIDKWVFLQGSMSPVSFADVLKNLRAQKTQASIWRRHVNHYFWDLSGIADDRARDVGQSLN